MNISEEQREHLTLLIEALESGDYQQGRYALKRINDGQPSYCCLGVGCDLYLIHTSGGRWKDGSEAVGFRVPFEDGNGLDHIEMPRSVQLWYGISNTVQQDLMGMNDSHQRSFKEIAQYLRETYNIPKTD